MNTEIGIYGQFHRRANCKAVTPTKMAGGLGAQSATEGAGPAVPPPPAPRKAVSLPVSIPHPITAEIRCISPLGKVIKVSTYCTQYLLAPTVSSSFVAAACAGSTNNSLLSAAEHRKSTLFKKIEKNWTKTLFILSTRVFF